MTRLDVVEVGQSVEPIDRARFEAGQAVFDFARQIAKFVRASGASVRLFPPSLDSAPIAAFARGRCIGGGVRTHLRGGNEVDERFALAL